MCHEGGHAFQTYLKRDEDIRDRYGYTSETAETHAMSMEFFAGPYMELIFGDRAEDYRRMHLEKAMRLVARECIQDEFEQLVYEPPEERNRLWQRLEREYLYLASQIFSWSFPLLRMSTACFRRSSAFASVLRGQASTTRWNCPAFRPNM